MKLTDWMDSGNLKKGTKTGERTTISRMTIIWFSGPTTVTFCFVKEETDEESDTDSQPGFEFHREERLDEQEDEEESGEEGDALPRIEHNDEQNGRNEDAVNAGEDNWRDWDRLGDELTWQRLLGLDGSLVFLEHVFWVISLNTLFTVIFGTFEVRLYSVTLSAYLPYRLGFYALGQLGAMEHIHYFPSVAAIIAGYFMLAFFLYGVHSVCGFFRWKM